MKNLKLRLAMAALVAKGHIRDFNIQLDNGYKLSIGVLSYSGDVRNMLAALEGLKEAAKNGGDFKISGDSDEHLIIKNLKIGQGANQMVLEHLEFKSSYEALNFALQFKELDLSEF